MRAQEDHDFYRELRNHVLELVQEGKVTAYYLRRPDGGRMMSTLIVFSPEGIALMGDLTPERNGSVSCIGYGRDWFSGRLSSGYLCEKFLTKRWIKEITKRRLRDRQWHRDSGFSEETIERLAELADELDDHGPEWLGDELHEIGVGTDGIGGWDYDPAESGWLVAIQRRFGELMRQQAPAVAGVSVRQAERWETEGGAIVAEAA